MIPHNKILHKNGFVIKNSKTRKQIDKCLNNRGERRGEERGNDCCRRYLDQHFTEQQQCAHKLITIASGESRKSEEGRALSAVRVASAAYQRRRLVAVISNGCRSLPTTPT